MGGSGQRKMESRAGVGECGGREERDPLSNNSSRHIPLAPCLAGLAM